jgi:hypothetical protein
LCRTYKKDTFYLPTISVKVAQLLDELRQKDKCTIRLRKNFDGWSSCAGDVLKPSDGDENVHFTSQRSHTRHNHTANKPSNRTSFRYAPSPEYTPAIQSPRVTHLTPAHHHARSTSRTPSPHPHLEPPFIHHTRRIPFIRVKPEPDTTLPSLEAVEIFPPTTHYANQAEAYLHVGRLRHHGTQVPPKDFLGIESTSLSHQHYDIRCKDGCWSV